MPLGWISNAVIQTIFWSVHIGQGFIWEGLFVFYRSSVDPAAGVRRAAELMEKQMSPELL